MSLNPVQMAARFYDARDALRTALGEDRYQEVVDPWRKALRIHADWLHAAIGAMKRAQAGGHGELVGVILAACADLADADDRKAP